MPQAGWSKKRERQYEHIKEGLEDRGRSEDLAEEIAARTVNKERARAGEAKQASRTSTDDISSGRRGGLRSHSGSGGRTRDQLYAEARKKNVHGRSTMTKAQLQRAVDAEPAPGAAHRHPSAAPLRTPSPRGRRSGAPTGFDQSRGEAGRTAGRTPKCVLPPVRAGPRLSPGAQSSGGDGCTDAGIDARR